MASDICMTIYLKPKIYRDLKVKAATTDRSVSDLVNATVLESLREDAVDLEALERRAKEPSRSFEKVLDYAFEDETKAPPFDTIGSP
jgi:hypothetical protein